MNWRFWRDWSIGLRMIEGLIAELEGMEEAG